MTVAVIDNFLYGYLVVAMVLLAERVLGGTGTVGWLNAGLSLGALGAMAVVNRMAAHTPAGAAAVRGDDDLRRLHGTGRASSAGSR